MERAPLAPLGMMLMLLLLCSGGALAADTLPAGAKMSRQPEPAAPTAAASPKPKAAAATKPPAKAPLAPAAPKASACPYTLQELRERAVDAAPVAAACAANATGPRQGCGACQCSAAAFGKILAVAITSTAEEADGVGEKCVEELILLLEERLPGAAWRKFKACALRDDAAEAAAACADYDVRGAWGDALADGGFAVLPDCPLYSADELRKSMPDVVARFAFDVDAAARVADKRERCLMAVCASAEAVRSVAKKYVRTSDVRTIGGLTIEQTISCVAEVDSALPSDTQKVYQKINDDACAAVPELTGDGLASAEALCSGPRATPAWAGTTSAAAAALAARPLALAAAAAAVLLAVATL